MPMSEEKLARLRALDAREPFEHLDPAVAGYVEELAGVAWRPYAGPTSLLGAPRQEDLADLDVALVGVPMDLGVMNRPGARFGPRALRGVSMVGPYHHHSKILPFTLCRIADVGDVPIESHHGLDDAIAEIESYYHRAMDADVVPLSVGGDHSITYPILKALGRDEPVGCVHIDAHCDTAAPMGGSKFHHGGPFRTAAVAGVLDPERTIQIGIRGAAEMIWDFSYESGMTVIHIEAFREMGVDAVIEKIHRVVGDGPTYVSLDVDGLDPAYAPGTGTPEVGGLTPFEAQKILRSLQGLPLVGADVVEVAPQYDPTSNTAQVGATMLFELLCVIADAVSKRRGGGG